MYTLNRILADRTRRPVSHRLGQPISDDIACEVLEGESVEIGHADLGALLTYTLGLDGETETICDAIVGVDVEQGAVKAPGASLTETQVVFYNGDIVATITLLDDQRSYVKVFPTGLQVTSDPDD
jgi:hypothetical protein